MSDDRPLDDLDLYRAQCAMIGASLLFRIRPRLEAWPDPELENVRAALIRTQEIREVCELARPAVERLGGPMFLAWCIELFESLNRDAAKHVQIRRQAESVTRSIEVAEAAVFKAIAAAERAREQYRRAIAGADAWIKATRDAVAKSGA